MIERRIDAVLLITAGVIAASTLLFPLVDGYGTNLYQLVVLSGWALVAGPTSAEFADTHHSVVVLSGLVTNILIFLVVAVPIWITFKVRAPRVGTVALILWCGFYLVCLFALFPATDGS